MKTFLSTGGGGLCPGKILPGKIMSKSFFFVQEKFCHVQLGVENYIDRREAPEIFEGIINPPPDSAADFGRIRPNSGQIADFLEFVSKLHGKVCWRRRRR